MKSVRTSQETHYVSATKSNRLMMFREIIVVYCENHTEHVNTLCRHNAEIIYMYIYIYIQIQFVPHRKHITSPLQSPNRLMTFSEIIVVYCENHTEQINTLCGQNAELLNVKASK
jgi:hypothetical protein